MELREWGLCHSKCSKEAHPWSATPWESLWEACSDIVQTLTDVTPGCKRLILHLAFCGTRIKIDLKDVKTAGVVCVLGIGFSVGSFLLYKLCYRILNTVVDKSVTQSSEEQENTDDCRIFIQELDGKEACEEEMGNSQSERETLPAFYSRGGGVEFGQRSKNKLMSKSSMLSHEYMQLRQRRPVNQLKRQSAEIADDDNDIEENESLISHGDSSGSESDNEDPRRSISPMLGLEINVVTEDGLPNAKHGSRHDSLTPSMKGNFSPSSLYEKNMRFSDADVGENNWPGECGEKYLPVVPNDLDLAHSSVLLTPPSDDDGPFTKLNSVHRHSGSKSPPYTPDSNEQNHRRNIYNKRSSFSDTVEKYEGGKLNISDKDDYINTEMLIARLNSPERESRQNLLQRLHEFAFSLSGTASTTPSPSLSTPEFSKKAFSVDKYDSDLGTPEHELFEVKNVEEESVSDFGKIETEIQSIEDEFSYLFSKLEELKSRGCEQEEDDEEFSDFVGYSPTQPLSKRVCKIVQKAKSVLENSPSISFENCDIFENDVFDQNSPIGDIDEHESRTQTDLNKADTVNMKSMSPATLTVEKNSSTSASSGGELPVCEQLAADLEVDSAAMATDSEAVCSLSHRPETLRVVSIGEKHEITTYAKKEWQGQTDKAEIMRKAYAKIPTILHCDHLHCIRGDNYCGIRSSLFQIFVNGISLVHKYCSLDSVLETLHILFDDASSGLQDWTFAGRLKYDVGDQLPLMDKCLLTLFTKLEEVQSLSSYEEREMWTMNCFNFSPESEIQMMEAVKLLMFLDSSEMFQNLQKVVDVPVFAWLMFARDTCPNPRMFVQNHLNELGNSAGIEQVEMFLLGHALGVMIRVLRLQQLNDDDFVSYYPDEIMDSWPQISLIAEDDRHYNVPVP
ncbi:hypothetical protein ScPMuIL_016446 [Solemya velum]